MSVAAWKTWAFSQCTISLPWCHLYMDAGHLMHDWSWLCFLFCAHLESKSKLEEARLHHWLHPLRSCHCSRVRRLPWPRPPWPHPPFPSRGRRPLLNGEWLANRLSQGPHPLTTWRGWLSCHLCFIAASHDGSGEEEDEEGKKAV